MSGAHKPLGGGRAVSSVLGFILVVGMVIMATLVIVTVGAVTFQQSQDQVTMESAVTGMEELNERILTVASDSDQQASVSMPSMEGASLSVEETGWVNVSVEYAENGTVVDDRTTGRIDLGKIVYDRGDQSVAIQAGGVWRTNRGGDAVAMVSEPTFQYRYGSGNPTLSFPIVNLTGTSIGNGEVTVSQLRPSKIKLSQVNPIQPGQQLNVTVKSDFYTGWYGLFNSRTNGSVKILGGKQTRLILDGPTLKTGGGTATGALLAPYSSMYPTNNNTIDSYDSRVGPYTNTSQVHNRSFVAAKKDINLTNAVTIKGPVHTGETFKSSNTIEIAGEVRVKNDVLQISNPSKFGTDGNKTFAVGGNMTTLSNQPTFFGDVIVGGDVESNNAPTFYEDLHAGGDVELSPDSTVGGDVIVDGNLTYKGSDSFSGRIHTSGQTVTFDAGTLYTGPEVVTEGDLELRNPSEIIANVTTGGNITLQEDSRIEGTVRTKGDVILNKNAEIIGNVSAGGNVILKESGTLIQGHVTTNGQVQIEDDGQINGNVEAKQSTDADSDAIELGDSNAEIDGNAKSGVGIDETPGTITGTQTTGASIPSVSVSPNPKKPLDPPEPQIPEPDPSPATSVIETRGNEIKNTGTIIDGSDPRTDLETAGDCTISNCTLEAGEYYLDAFKITSDGAILDTTNGDIEIFVDGKVFVREDVNVVGSGDVIMHVNSTLNGIVPTSAFRLGSNAVLGNMTSQDATQLTVFMRPTAGASMGGTAKFVGLLYGPGSPTQTGTDMSLDGDTEIYGAILGHPNRVAQNVKIHYDEALRASGGGTNTIAKGPEQVEYVRLSVVGASVD